MSGRPPSYLRGRHQAPARTTEQEFQETVLELAKWKRWPLAYHTFDSRRSAPGYPDLTLCKPGRLLFLELKSATGKPTPEQLAWLGCLETVTRVDAMLARPADLAAIERLLS